MHRYTLHVADERHAFVNMISDKIVRTHSDVFAASRVSHPLATEAEVVLDAASDTEARSTLIAACRAIAADIDAMLRSLGMSHERPALFQAAAMPRVHLTCAPNAEVKK